jgi:hypothetical protein
LAQWLYTCWISTNKIWKISLIYFQLVLEAPLINSMLNHFFSNSFAKCYFATSTIPWTLHQNPSFCSLFSSKCNIVTFVHNPPTFSLHQLGPDSYCCNPTLAKCGGEAQHFQSWGFGVLWDSRMFRARQQGPKHLALSCFWCHWKGLEA